MMNNQGLMNQINKINTIKTGPAFQNGEGVADIMYNPRSITNYPLSLGNKTEVTSQRGPINNVFRPGTVSSRQQIQGLPYPYTSFPGYGH
jgi:hypothetical protein